MASREHHLGWGLVALALFILYWLNSKGLLHESVSSKIVTSLGTVVPDPLTGFPQYDPADASTIPAGIAEAVAPIAADGTVTSHPSDPTKLSCPIGTSPWHNAADDSYWCVPTS